MARAPRVRRLFPLALTPAEVSEVTGMSIRDVKQSIVDMRLPAYRKPGNVKARQFVLVEDIVSFVRRELERV